MLSGGETGCSGVAGSWKRVLKILLLMLHLVALVRCIIVTGE